MPATNMYNQILSRAQTLIATSKHTRHIDAKTAGDITLEPNTLLLHQTSFMYQEVETEINLTSAAARPPYHWLVEITVRSTPRRHYLLTDEGVIVEAYGKQISSVDTKNAQALLEHLESLS